MASETFANSELMNELIVSDKRTRRMDVLLDLRFTVPPRNPLAREKTLSDTRTTPLMTVKL